MATNEAQLKQKQEYDEVELKQFNAAQLGLQLIAGVLTEQQSMDSFDSYLEYLNENLQERPKNFDVYVSLLRTYYADMIVGNFNSDSFYNIYDYYNDNHDEFVASSKVFKRHQAAFLYPQEN